MSGVAPAPKLRDLRRPFDGANALPVARCDVRDTRSRPLVERNAAR